MPVRCPDDFLAVGMQMLDDFEPDTGGDHPVGACLHGRAGVGVNHDGAVGVFIAEFGEFTRWATKIE